MIKDLHTYPNSLKFYRAPEPCCPHCGEREKSTAGDIHEACTEGEHQLTCNNCGKDYRVRVRTEVKLYFTTLEAQHD